MFLRDTSGQTLTDVREALDDRTETVSVVNSQIRVDLVNDGAITLNVSGTETREIVVPATEDSVGALATWVDVPAKFFQRCDRELQQTILTRLLSTNPAGAHVVLRENEILQVRNPNDKVINPRRLIEATMRVLDPAAPVVDWWRTADDFRVDVIVPEGFERGIGGDSAVGDLTRAGVRLGQDTKHNLAPYVQPFNYRLVCTNGMETRDDGFKIEMRGASVEEVLSEFESQADRAFRRAEADIAAFYDLRQQRVENPERTIIRMARERGLPDRTAMALAERIPALNESGEVTMFDLVNLITNQANDPTIRTRAGARRSLEVVGGSLVTEHAERCGHCQARLN